VEGARLGDAPEVEPRLSGLGAQDVLHGVGRRVSPLFEVHDLGPETRRRHGVDGVARAACGAEGGGRPRRWRSCRCVCTILRGEMNEHRGAKWCGEEEEEERSVCPGGWGRGRSRPA